MDVALADSKGVENFRGLIVEKRIARKCKSLSPPLLLIVDCIYGNNLLKKQRLLRTLKFELWF